MPEKDAPFVGGMLSLWEDTLATKEREILKAWVVQRCIFCLKHRPAHLMDRVTTKEGAYIGYACKTCKKMKAKEAGNGN